MVDRIALMHAVERQIAPTETQRIALRKKVDDALAAMILVLPLDRAQTLAAKERDELALAIDGILPAKQLEALSKSWEPDRKLDASTNTQLAKDLVELLRGQRPPYVKITATLAQARAVEGRERTILAQAIERLAPLKELQALAKKWDKLHLEAQEMSRRALAAHLRALMEGYVEPVAPAARQRAGSAPPSARARAAAE